MGGGYRSLRFEQRTLSHVVHTRCLIFLPKCDLCDFIGYFGRVHHARG